MAVQTACVQTIEMDDNDECKFSMRTPKRGTSAYLRLLNGGIKPTNDQIIQDVYLCRGACVAISKAKGKVVINF